MYLGRWMDTCSPHSGASVKRAPRGNTAPHASAQNAKPSDRNKRASFCRCFLYMSSITWDSQRIALSSSDGIRQLHAPHIYGPLCAGALGKLGPALVSFSSCTFAHVVCESGRTAASNSERLARGRHVLCGQPPLGSRQNEQLRHAQLYFLDTFVDAGRTSGRSVRRVFPRIPHSGQRGGSMAHIRLRTCEWASRSSLSGGGGTSPVQPQPPVSDGQVNMFFWHTRCTARPPSGTSHGL